MFAKKTQEESTNVETKVEKKKHGARAVTRRDPFGPSLMAPFPPLRRFMEDMERMFEDFGRGFPTPAAWRLPEMAKLGWMPEAEVFEKKGILTVRVDLPGLTREDVKVEVKEQELTLSGERKTEHEEQNEGYYRTERHYGSFSRTIPLPEGVKVEKAKATFQDGVLEVTMPVPPREAPKVHHLEIGGGGKTDKVA
jgi:HSP20 family protein